MSEGIVIFLIWKINIISQPLLRRSLLAPGDILRRCFQSVKRHQLGRAGPQHNHAYSWGQSGHKWLM